MLHCSSVFGTGRDKHKKAALRCVVQWPAGQWGRRRRARTAGQHSEARRRAASPPRRGSPSWSSPRPRRRCASQTRWTSHSTPRSRTPTPSTSSWTSSLSSRPARRSRSPRRPASSRSSPMEKRRRPLAGLVPGDGEEEAAVGGHRDAGHGVGVLYPEPAVVPADGHVVGRDGEPVEAIGDRGERGGEAEPG